MAAANAAALVINSICIVLTVLMLVLILWQDARSTATRLYAFFVFFVVMWSGGTLLSRIAALIGATDTFIGTGVQFLQLGFTGACVGAYLLAISLTGGLGKRLNQAVLIGGLVMVALQGVLIFASATSSYSYSTRGDGALLISFSGFGTLLYSSFAASTLILVWQRRRKIKYRSLQLGLTVFCLAIFIDVISPELRLRAIGVNLAVISMVVMGYAMLRANILDPLAGRASQLQVVRDVGLAITSSLRLEAVLETIARQAAEILHANGAAIFLTHNHHLYLAAEYNLSPKFRGATLMLGEGFVGKVAETRRAESLEDYRRDWDGGEDLPYANQGFGSVAAAPLMLNQDVLGVLLAIQSVGGARFEREDLRLLELLAPQAAVAIANSRLFENQHKLTEELEMATTQLRGLDQAKTQMIQMTSHQLKNPLFAATSTLENLREEHPDLPEPALRDLETIWAALKRMERIVTNILNLERVQAGALSYQPIAIEEVLQSILSDFASQISGKRLQLSQHIDTSLPLIRGDRHYLSQALANLLENAIKFTASGGTLTVSARAETDTVIVRVADSGIGIPAEALTRVFEKFFRVQQAGIEHVRGSGLGLSLVKAVVDGHGGRVWVESAVGVGTTFTIALPTYRDSSAQNGTQMVNSLSERPRPQ